MLGARLHPAQPRPRWSIKSRWCGKKSRSNATLHRPGNDFPIGLTAEGPVVISTPSSLGNDFLTLKDTNTGHQVGIQTAGLGTDPNTTSTIKTDVGGQFITD